MRLSDDFDARRLRRASQETGACASVPAWALCSRLLAFF